MKRWILAAVLGTAAALIGCGPDGINGSVLIDPGQKVGDVSRVNGSISLGEGATAEEVTTVNGGIDLGARASATSATAVNGGISLGDGARVSGDIVTVNGGVRLSNGADVGGQLRNVNGGIQLVGAHVGGGIVTANGDIEVGAKSHVEGGIHVKPADGVSFGFGDGTVRVVIGPEAVVDGTLRFERPVKLYVSETARVGEIEGATPERFSGERPPR